MRTIRRAILPALLAIVGVGALLEGMLFHPVSVIIKEETETKTTIEIPLMMPPGPSTDEPPSADGPPSFPPGMPFGGPTSIKQTVTRIDPAIIIMVPEPELMRDVSVGGVVRLASGELKRTYSGKGPALCPS